MEKLLTRLIALALLVTCVVMLPVAATEANPSGTCGKNITWVLDSDGTLTISGSGSMYIDEHDSAPWFELNDYIQKVIIEDGITTIGLSAFYRCSNLSNVSIPDSIVKITDEAFSRCSSLTEITIPASVTEIGVYAFTDCSSLTSITVDPQNPVYHSDGNCLIETATKTLHTGCSASVIPADGSVTTIGVAAFSGCSNLTGITIPNSIVLIDMDAFMDCTNLTDITLPDTIAEIGRAALAGCNRLTSITIPRRVQSIQSDTFYGCTSLTTITIPDSVIEIGHRAFSGCDNLWHVLYMGSEYNWNTIEIKANGNSSFLDAITHHNAVGDKVDPVNKVCTICTPPPTEPPETIAPTQPTETIAPLAPSEPVEGNETYAGSTVWVIVAAAVVLVVVGAVGIVLWKKKH